MANNNNNSNTIDTEDNFFAAMESFDDQPRYLVFHPDLAGEQFELVAPGALPSGFQLNNGSQTAWQFHMRFDTDVEF